MRSLQNFLIPISFNILSFVIILINIYFYWIDVEYLFEHLSLLYCSSYIIKQFFLFIFLCKIICYWSYYFIIFYLGYYTIGKFIFIFISNLFIFLFLTLIIATITLIERKLLSLIQRRVGPNYVGYKGRLQFIADALKLLLKHIYIINSLNRLFFIIIPAVVLIMCYLFWMNIIWGPSLAICEIEYNLLFMGVLSTLFSILLFLVGWISKNKYAILSSNRVVVITLNLELFLSFIFLFILLTFESFSFYQIVSFQYSQLWGILLFLPILPLLIIIFLLETGRIPFDLGEAESELIAGYTTEMGGFFFALFYLGEYFHLFCFSAVYVLCFFGGWLS